MLIIAILLIIGGVLPVVFTLVFSVLTAQTLFGINLLPKPTYQSVTSWYSVPRPVPWSNLGGSAIRLITGAARYLTGKREPQFSTLGCKASQLDKAKWRLEIEFQIINPSLHREIVIDDLHTCLYERNAYAPALMTISFFGDVWMRQDNSILKERRSYSLSPGDGYIINLLFEVTRIEAAPAYGERPHESEGSVAIVFGLLFDYYFQGSAGLDRRAIPSDNIYLFTYSRRDQDAKLQALNAEKISDLRMQNLGYKLGVEFVDGLKDYLWEHLSFRPEPVS